MTSLDINNKYIELKIDFGFIKKANNKYKVNQNGAEVGIGVQQIYSSLLLGDPFALVDFIYFAQSNSDQKVTHDEVMDYLENLDDLDWLFDDFLQLMKSSSVTKRQVKAMEAEVQKVQADLNQNNIL